MKTPRGQAAEARAAQAAAENSLRGERNCEDKQIPDTERGEVCR